MTGANGGRSPGPMTILCDNIWRAVIRPCWNDSRLPSTPLTSRDRCGRSPLRVSANRTFGDRVAFSSSRRSGAPGPAFDQDAPPRNAYARARICDGLPRRCPCRLDPAHGLWAGYTRFRRIGGDGDAAEHGPDAEQRGTLRVSKRHFEQLKPAWGHGGLEAGLG